MSQELLVTLTASDDPFFCLMCSREVFKQQVSQLVAEISSLKAELKVIPSMQASIETLKGEITELRKLCSAATAPTTSYANAVSRQSRFHPNPNHKRNKAAGPAKAQPATTITAAASASASASASINPGGNSEKVKIPGVRRVWKTMRSATSFTISSTFKKLTSVGSKLSIRRRTGSGSASGKSTYWFVLKSNEDILQKLEEEWDQVQMQLGWKLENCYKLNTPNTPQQVQAGDEDKCSNRNDDIAPASVSESPKRLSPAKISPKANEVGMTNDHPDGTIEQHRACTPTVGETDSLTTSQD